MAETAGPEADTPQREWRIAWFKKTKDNGAGENGDSLAPLLQPPTVEEQEKPKRKQPPLSFGQMLFGVLLIGAGFVWMLDVLGAVDVRAGIAVPIALLAIGVTLMVGSYDGPHVGLTMLGGVIALGLIVIAASPLEAIGDGIGRQEHRPTSPLEVEDPYQLGIGSLELDLTALQVSQDLDMHAEVGIGELVVIVPEGLAIEIDAAVQAGEIVVFGDSADGTDVSTTYTSAGFSGAAATVTLELDVLLGTVKVESP